MAFPAEFDLSSLDGNNGFVIVGANFYNSSGISVSDAGDVNGDGIDDIIIGNHYADPNSTYNAGESYVVFGSITGFDTSLNLSTLDGTNGFAINGIDVRDYSGRVVSGAGDINGDGIDDVIIGARYADPNGMRSAGESYVVFGSSAGFDSSLELSDLDGSDGFVINGIDGVDFSGAAVSDAGDVNGDGIDDIIIGARYADPNSTDSAGESYVVFGSSAGFDSSLELSDLDGSNGFVINGVDEGDFSGFAVSSAGDVNGDGIDDVIIGARYVYGLTGASYVVFGSSNGFGSSFELSSLDGTNGFVINGIDSLDRSGTSVSSAGDINGDGIDDVLIGSSGDDSYVVFGTSTGFGSSLNLSTLDGTNGFIISGLNIGLGGISVSSAGDINGDGIDDLLIGSPGNLNGQELIGQSAVVFGSNENFSSSLDISSLDGTNGFIINGINERDFLGNSVSSAGDINGDGIDDLLIGAPYAEPGSGEAYGTRNTGETYVIFGRSISDNGIPDAVNDEVSTDENTLLSGTVFVDNSNGADTDPDGDSFTVTAVNGIAADVGNLVTLTSGAMLTLNADGTFSYDPNGQFENLNDGDIATDSFTYTIGDSSGGT
ncbi:MAG: hypothetical protein F6K19_32855, partial [Cyanothece sp. SIO1E1]|nr:hypothetical protein [Cyanothece sp. SIO1E1]